MAEYPKLFHVKYKKTEVCEDEILADSPEELQQFLK
jgi:hypothetical protein